jgi:hypothetical protein
MSAMAVEATRAANMGRVLDRALLVAALAGRRLNRGPLVRMMAIAAGGRAVLHQGGEVALRLAVAIDARRSRARSEGVARQAIRFRGAAGMALSGLLFVATAAHRRAGIRKAGPFDIVTVLAHDRALPNVLLVSRAGSILHPRGGHRCWNDFGRSSGKDAEKSGHTCGGEHQHAGQDAENGAPFGALHKPP